MINLNVKAGYLRKIKTEEDAKRRMFSLAVKRDFKNKDGKYDYDHFTFFYYAADKGPAAFIENFIEDGDLVCVKGHDSSYTTMGDDGRKIYHEDKICDEISILAKGRKEENEASGDAESEGDDGYVLCDDEDLMF